MFLTFLQSVESYYTFAEIKNKL